jgi:hypothetical protein
MSPEEQTQLAQLLRTGRWAALASARDNEPLASWVAVVRDEQPGAFLLHLSHLALHTRYLFSNPRASLAFSEPDRDGGRDPQTLARVSLQGRMATLARDTGAYESGRARYLAALPHAAVQFSLGDFHLMRFVSESARYVPGFGRAHRLDAEALRSLLSADD